MRASRGEIKIEEILKQYNIPFKEEYSFEDLKAENGKLLRFDFAIFDDDGNIVGPEYVNWAAQKNANAGFKAGKHELLPFPTAEINVNSNLTQNPGY